MRVATCLTAVALVLTSTVATVQLASAGVRPQNVTTVSQNLLRDGWDPNEPALSPGTVSGGGFGQLFATHVDAQVYAQPLVVDTPGTATTAPASSVIVATENDTVYSLNATTGAIQWQRTVGTPWLSSAIGCSDLSPLVGITSTPVYDPATQTVYVVAVTTGGNESTKTPAVTMYALNEQTGAIKWNKTISGSPTNAPKLKFNPALERQRTGLLLLNGWIYFGFASYCDNGDYIGFVSGVHTTDHSQTLWSAETGSAQDQAGIWHAGGGLMSDGAGRIFLTTGNGVSPPPGPGTPTPSELGDSVIRLSVNSNGTLAARDFFSPANAPTLDRADTDFGSGGPTGLPFGTSKHPGLLVQAGKDGRLFLLDTHALGGRSATTDQPVSTSGAYGGQWGHPAAFAGAGGNDYVYYSGVNDFLRVLKFDGSNAATPVLRDVANSPGVFGYSSGSPVITSNGTDPASAIVWEVSTPGTASTTARLEAFLAVPQAGKATLTQIWSAPVGQSAKFAVAATDSGRVYVGSRNDGTDTAKGVVYGFGASNAMPLLGKQVDFGAVGVSGPAKTVTATIAATQDLRVAGITGTSSASPSPFALGTPSVNGTAVAGFPLSLTAGQKLAVPVTFTPAATGSVAGSLDLTTNVQGFPKVSIPLTGVGATPGLAAYPASLAFGANGTGASFDPNNGPVPVGSSQSFPADIVNTGTTAETVSSVTAPAAPFSLTGLSQGTVLQPGQAATVTVTYKPSQVTSADAGSFTVTDSDGTSVTVALSGTSVAGAGALTASRTSVGFSTVALGRSVSADVTLTNTGNLPLTVTGFTGPRVPFGAPVPVTTGLGINPDDSITVPVTFTPQSKGAFTGQYALTTTDGRNLPETTTITFSGTGVAQASGVVVPSPGGGWTTNGSATVQGTTLQLTPAVVDEAGSAVYNQGLSSNGLRATFTARLSGGTGADGLTFALINPTDTASALGGAGGLLGFGGLHGVAVVLATHKAANFPSANFVGLSSGTSAGNLVINASTTAVPNLRTGTHQIGVAVSGKTITVTVDGKQAVTASFPALPAIVMPAFTAATGTGTDVHAVSGVAVSAGSGPLPPPGGGWSFNGVALRGSDTYLTHAAVDQKGTVIYPRAVSTANISATFNVQIGGGTGANGMAFALLSPTTKPTAIGAAGAGLGLAGLPGIGVVLSTYQPAGAPSDNYIAITSGTLNGQPIILQYSGAVPPLRTGTHTVTITLQASVLSVSIDGTRILRRPFGALPPKMLLAFTAATGSKTDSHLIRNAAITATGF
jgi:hypothetical protein